MKDIKSKTALWASGTLAPLSLLLWFCQSPGDVDPESSPVAVAERAQSTAEQGEAKPPGDDGDPGGRAGAPSDPVSPLFDVYAIIDGVKGSGPDDKVRILDFDHTVEIPFDDQGQLTGTRRHRGIQISTDVELTTVPFHQAVSEGLTYAEATIEFWRTLEGQSELYYSLALESVKVFAADTRAPDAGDVASQDDGYKVSYLLKYEKITWNYSQGQYVFSDSWQGSGDADADTDSDTDVDTDSDTDTDTDPNTPPVAVCRDATAQADPTCQGAANIDDGSHDADGEIIGLLQDPANPYGMGDTQVTLTVTDDDGDEDSCTATVTVVDTSAPNIICPENLVLDCMDTADPANTGVAVVTDNCEALEPTYTDTLVDVCAGNFMLYRDWNAADTSGNITHCQQVIHIRDMSGPSIDSSPRSYTICEPGETLTIVTPQIDDACDDTGNLTVTAAVVAVNGVGVNLPITDGQIALPSGQHVIRWIATDGASNQTIADQTIDVALDDGPNCCQGFQSVRHGSDGSNSFYWSYGPVCYFGHGSQDTIVTYGHAQDYISGGSGGDYIDVRSGGSTIVGNGGSDYIYTSCDNSVYGGEGADSIICYNGGNGKLVGGPGDDSIQGGYSNDIIVPGSGSDYVYAGSGDDRVYIYHECELEFGETLYGGYGSDILYLPQGITEVDLYYMGIYHTFEAVLTTDPALAIFSDCI